MPVTGRTPDVCVPDGGVDAVRSELVGRRRPHLEPAGVDGHPPNPIDCLLGGKGQLLKADRDHKYFFLTPGWITFWNHFEKSKEKIGTELIDANIKFREKQKVENQIITCLSSRFFLDTCAARA